MISTILDTFSTEMRLLLKYVKPTMLKVATAGVGWRVVLAC